jgi:hypothetical protein
MKANHPHLRCYLSSVVIYRAQDSPPGVQTASTIRNPDQRYDSNRDAKWITSTSRAFRPMFFPTGTDLADVCGKVFSLLVSFASLKQGEAEQST